MHTTVQDWIRDSSKKLTTAGIETARLDTLVLLEDTLAKDRSWLLAHPEYQLHVTQIHTLEAAIARRRTHEPLAYIRGKTEFYGRNFSITPDVLEPRPESETMIELLKSLGGAPAHQRLMDVGTGSGALGITAALELSPALLACTDIDPRCLKIAQQNATSHTVTAQFIESDLLSSSAVVQCAPTVILANLPYVPDNYPLNKAAGNEPQHAIFGGTDGLDLYRTLFAQTAALTPTLQYILTESLPFQHAALQVIASQYGYQTCAVKDFILVFTRT